MPSMSVEEIETTISIMNKTDVVQNDLLLTLVRQLDAVEKRLLKLETKEETSNG